MKAPSLARSLILKSAVGILLLWALLDRVYALGRWPGINADEAWYGVQLLRFSAGQLESWRTPNGNFPGPLHVGLLWGLLKVLPRAFWVLRVPTVLSSLAAVGVTFVALRRHFDSETATIAALLQACVPVGIVYARLGWDPSHAPLLGALGLSCALAGRLWPLALLFAFALLCHPTNVFVAPFLSIVFATRVWQREGLGSALRRSALLLAALVVSLPLLMQSALGTHTTGAVLDPLSRLVSAAEWARFIAALGDFFSGAASFAYTAGPPLVSVGTSGAWLLGGCIGIVTLAGAALGTPLGRIGAGVCAGFVATLVTFAVLAGAHALDSHYERYGLVLVTPGVVTAAVLIRRLSGGRLPADMGLAVAVLFAAVGLMTTHVGYFAALARTGSLSHKTFWTGDREPKQAAWERVLATRPSGMPVRIAADGFWSYQPLLFLAWGSAGVTVERSQGPYSLRANEALYVIGFNDGSFPSLDAEVRRHATLQQWSVPGTERAEVLRVVRLLPAD